jgi:hypothetical protein
MTTPTRPGPRATVLLVDDVLDFRAEAAAALAQAGYDVVAARPPARRSTGSNRVSRSTSW